MSLSLAALSLSRSSRSPIARFRCAGRGGRDDIVNLLVRLALVYVHQRTQRMASSMENRPIVQPHDCMIFLILLMVELYDSVHMAQG